MPASLYVRVLCVPIGQKRASGPLKLEFQMVIVSNCPSQGDCIKDGSMTVKVWTFSVPYGQVCLYTFCPAGGAIFEACKAFRMWSLTRESRWLGEGLWRLYWLLVLAWFLCLLVCPCLSTPSTLVRTWPVTLCSRPEWNLLLLKTTRQTKSSPFHVAFVRHFISLSKQWEK